MSLISKIRHSSGCQRIFSCWDKWSNLCLDDFRFTYSNTTTSPHYTMSSVL